MVGDEAYGDHPKVIEIFMESSHVDIAYEIEVLQIDIDLLSGVI